MCYLFIIIRHVSTAGTKYSTTLTHKQGLYSHGPLHDLPQTHLSAYVQCWGFFLKNSWYWINVENCEILCKNCLSQPTFFSGCHTAPVSWVIDRVTNFCPCWKWFRHRICWDYQKLWHNLSLSNCVCFQLIQATEIYCWFVYVERMTWCQYLKSPLKCKIKNMICKILY